MKLAQATFFFKLAGVEYIVWFLPGEVVVTGPDGELTRTKNTDKRLKPCETHAKGLLWHATKPRRKETRAVRESQQECKPGSIVKFNRERR